MSNKITMETSGRSTSCPKLETSEEKRDAHVSLHSSSSLPTSLSEDWKKSKPCSMMTSSSEGGKCQEETLKLVQNCGPDCMVTQRIVDRLLARMLHLENERSELLAANRSWAVQFQMMQEKHEMEMKKLQEDLRRAKSKEEKASEAGEIKTSSDQLNLLTHQAEIYREDFMEERKARVRAHAQIEALRSELKRERKSRAKLSALVQQNKVCEETAQVLS